MASKDAPRILISRLGPIGDAILTMPVACALRRKYPHAHIGWVVEKPAARMLRNHESVDALIELPPEWNRSIKNLQSVRQELRKHKFQHTIDCQGGLWSSLLCRFTSAKKRIGFAGSASCVPARLLNNIVVTPVFTHVTDRCLELLTPLGVNAPKIRWNVPLTHQSREWAAGWRRTLRSDKLTVLNPGGTHPAKLWEADRFGTTARYLRDRYDHQCAVIWRTPEEQIMAQRIVDFAKGAAMMVPETDLHHLGALIETADLFISGDTGPLHLAVAVGTPTIGLYGAT